MSLIDDIDPEILANTIATIGTLGPDGNPQMTAVWFGIENGKLLVSATARRQKVKNLEADGRCSVLIFHPGTFDYFVEIRGTAEVLDDADYAWITTRLVDIAMRHADGRIVSSLEGGYSLTALRESTAAHVDALLD